MNSDEYLTLLDRLKTLRHQGKGKPPEDVPDSVQLLRDLLKNADCDEDYIALNCLLSGEYVRFGMYDEAELLMREGIGKFPHQPIPRITLADFLVIPRDDLEQALAVAEEAVTTALADGNFVRDAYNCRARVAVKSKNYALLEDTLRELIDYRPKPGGVNGRYESYFLDSLPESTLDEELRKKYLQHIGE